MRALLVIIAALAGCTGEQVLIQTADTGTESSVDSAAVADTSSPGDSADASCTKLAGNLIPDGDFSTGVGAWRASDCQIERVPGPCGQALRLYNILGPARVEVSYPGKKLAKGTTVRLRAWFKKGSQSAPTTPSLFVRSFYNDADAGEVSKDYELFPSITDEWVLTDRVFTVEHEQTGFQVMVDVYREAGSTPQDLLVADISLVPVEP